MNSARHLVTVWNPAYAADAMDAYLRVLLPETIVPDTDAGRDSASLGAPRWWNDK